MKRVFRVSEAVKSEHQNPQDETKVKGNTSPKKDNHGGEYVDYKEVE